jgi:thiamine kinase-like enzyme
VLSHGDLFPANVVWSEKLSPFIIDWEAAGYIHPQLELWNVGLNWGGILVDDVRPEFFTALLEGYRSLKRPVFFDENMVHTGLGSWLAWLMYKLSGYSFDTDITIEDDIEIIRRIIKTYPVLLSLRGV